MLLRRIMTALWGLPVVVAAIVYLPTGWFFAFMLCIVGIALHEYFAMVLPSDAVRDRMVSVALGCTLPACIFWLVTVLQTSSMPMGMVAVGCAVFCVAALFFYYIVTATPPLTSIEHIGLACLGLLFIALPLSFILLIRALPDGARLLLLLISVTWLGDTAAYCIGTLFGRRRLCPHISPAKTVEGALASCAAAVSTAMLFAIIALPQITLLQGAVLGIGINVANQFGDLSESMLKRAFGMKDSGALLPGHGGMLDRIDSLLFAAPFLYLYIGLVTF